MTTPATLKRWAESSIMVPLSAREREVLQLTAEGLSNKHIAQKLKIAERTVKMHRLAIFTKINATNAPHAVAIAMRLGLVE